MNAVKAVKEHKLGVSALAGVIVLGACAMILQGWFVKINAAADDVPVLKKDMSTFQYAIGDMKTTQKEMNKKLDCLLGFANCNRPRSRMPINPE